MDGAQIAVARPHHSSRRHPPVRMYRCYQPNCFRSYTRYHDLSRHQLKCHYDKFSEKSLADQREDALSSEQSDRDSEACETRSESEMSEKADSDSEATQCSYSDTEEASERREKADAVLDDLVDEAVEVYRPYIDESDQGKQAAYQALRPVILKTLMELYFKMGKFHMTIEDTAFQDDIDRAADGMANTFGLSEEDSLWKAIKLKKKSFDALIPKDYPYADIDDVED